ncbi:uncharacterized protein LOC114416214 [Glycine soja]|uniref:uncharacterized protein LOC114416214 n=1 Tax=Glycine soja TaxID=3848 RepID=UPI00103CFE51|nr:uncharacterized protein LOC114416214 [Glycine soja]
MATTTDIQNQSQSHKQLEAEGRLKSKIVCNNQDSSFSHVIGSDDENKNYIGSKDIDERQTTFVKGRQLLHGVLIANEVVEEARRSKRPCMVFKVDFEKAYGSMSWQFLFYMMGRMGFCDRWIGWIKGCLTSASISILVNGNPTSEFKPQRALRQGDPLAPLLFVLVAEGLTGMMREASIKNCFQSFLVWKHKIPVNILEFADNTIFFGEASMDNVKAVKAILRSYEMVSGLRINFSKSHFGAIGQSEEWAPSAVINRLNAIQRHFLWGGNSERKKIASIAWSHQSDQLWSRILNSKYRGWRGLEGEPQKPNFSHWWSDLRSINQHGCMVEDSWVWGAASNGILSSKSACVCIKAEQSSEDHHLGFCQLWDTKISPRALTFAWRLLWDRLPSKENLSRRQVDLANDLCPFCQSNSKSASHLFFTCQKGLPLWWEFNTWVKEDRALHCRPMDHFLQHSSIAGSKASNTRKKIWWITATRSIWKLRNDVIFHNQAFHISKLVDNTNFLTWSWLRGWEKDFNAPFHQWS